MRRCDRNNKTSTLRVHALIAMCQNTPYLCNCCVNCCSLTLNWHYPLLESNTQLWISKGNIYMNPDKHRKSSKRWILKYWILMSDITCGERILKTWWMMYALQRLKRWKKRRNRLHQKSTSADLLLRCCIPCASVGSKFPKDKIANVNWRWLHISESGTFLNKILESFFLN